MRYDVAIAGGGTAGCILAARLTEEPSRRVCLVEAGPDYGPLADGAWPRELLDARRIPFTHDWDAGSELATPSRARVIGGCSAHNACLMLRGTRDDYDEWGDGWTADELAPFLERAESTFRTADAITAAPTAFHVAALEAAATSGVAAQPYRANAEDGVRWNAALAYLEDARTRENLTIAGDTLVARVKLDGNRAVALVTADGDEIDASTVVVAAGAYASPAILLRTGVENDAVGANLVDHAGLTVLWAPTEELLAATEPGFFASYGLITPRDLHLVPWLYEREAGLEPGISVFCMKPWSRGRVSLRSEDPRVPPLVEQNLASDRRDRDVIVRGIELVRELADTDALARFVGDERAPGDGADLAAYVDANARGYFHPVGTCAIGSVVDRNCRVHGIEGLLVADASVMPTIPRANTNLTVAAIAERVATTLEGAA